MKDEIKEILDSLQDELWSKTGCDSYDKLLDYITNLQTIEQQYSSLLSENAELENKITNLQEGIESQSKAQVILDDENAELQGKIMELQEENERIKHQFEVQKKITDENIKRKYNYKTRNEKAIEYITTEQLYTNYQWGKSQYVKILKDLLEILQGKSDE